MLRPLVPADAQAFRRLRLDGLQRFPTAFGASHAEAAEMPEAEFAARIQASAPGAIFGWFDTANLVGVAGLMRQTGEKSRHKATLWGVYVAPSHQGRGIARALTVAAIAQARTIVLQLHTAVVTDNAAAHRLYLSLGFRSYGIEPKALRVDGRFYDEDHLVLELDTHLPTA